MNKLFIIHNRGISRELLEESKIFSSKEKLEEYIAKNYGKKDIKNFNDDEITNDGEKLTIIDIDND